MMNYSYLEKREQYLQQDDYQLAPDILDWIDQELQKRLLQLKEKFPEESLEIFLTLRKHQQKPVFVVGYIKEGNKFIVEAWAFGFKMADNLAEYQVQMVLDSVPKDFFKEKPPQKDKLST